MQRMSVDLQQRRVKEGVKQRRFWSILTRKRRTIHGKRRRNPSKKSVKEDLPTQSHKETKEAKWKRDEKWPLILARGSSQPVAKNSSWICLWQLFSVSWSRSLLSRLPRALLSLEEDKFSIPVQEEFSSLISSNLAQIITSENNHVHSMNLDVAYWKLRSLKYNQLHWWP